MVETNIQSRLSHKYTEHFFPCSKKNQHPKQSRNNFCTWWFWCVALRHLSRICQCSVHCPLSPSRLTAQMIPTTTHDPLTHQDSLEGYEQMTMQWGAMLQWSHASLVTYSGVSKYLCIFFYCTLACMIVYTGG